MNRSIFSRLETLERRHVAGKHSACVSFIATENNSDDEIKAMRAKAVASWEARNGRAWPADGRAICVLLVAARRAVSPASGGLQ